MTATLDPETATSCGCPRVNHDHGTRATYVHHKCRCDACREANREYRNKHNREVLYGRARLVDATPVREHLRKLSAAGMGGRQVAAALDVNRSVIRKITGSSGAGRPPRRRIDKGLAARILAVTPEVAAGAIVDGTGTRRRIQALAWAGWSIAQIATATGTDRQALDALVNYRRSDTTRRTADRVAVFFSTHWDKTPTDADAASISRAKNRARRLGWFPALAWENIDDPLETPEAPAPLRPARRHRAAATAETLIELANPPFNLGAVEAAHRAGITARVPVDLYNHIRRLERRGALAPEQAQELLDRFHRNDLVNTHAAGALSRV